MDKWEPIIPLYIVIGATSYVINLEDTQWAKENGCVGMVDKERFTIHVAVEDRPASDILNTFIHELLHVCYQEWHIKPRCGEERTVTALGYAMSALLVQNPDLAACFQRLVEEARNGHQLTET